MRVLFQSSILRLLVLWCFVGTALAQIEGVSRLYIPTLRMRGCTRICLRSCHLPKPLLLNATTFVLEGLLLTLLLLQLCVAGTELVINSKDPTGCGSAGACRYNKDGEADTLACCTGGSKVSNTFGGLLWHQRSSYIQATELTCEQCSRSGTECLIRGVHSFCR
jgi:hypothetical protein